MNRFLFSWSCVLALLAEPRLFAQLADPTATAKPGEAKEEAPKVKMLDSFTNTVGMKMLPVPGTTVLFSEFETRVGEYEAFTKAAGFTRSFRPHFEQTSEHPVVGVTRQEAISFCNWLTEDEQKKGKIKPTQLYRLPSNEEWSAAAGLNKERSVNVATEDRLAEAMKFVWGLEWPPPEGSGNFQSNEIPGYKDNYPFTAPVGKFKPTQDGLYDLAGNVWEWTWDGKFSATPEGTLRGGSWAYFKRETLVASYVYDKVPADLRAPTVGFRVVFEDRERTAELLAAANADQLKAEAEKKKEFMNPTKVDTKAVEAVLKRTSSASADAVIDPSTLSPARRGQVFKNPLSMEFVPVTDLPNVLVGRMEVTLQAINAWIKSAGREALPQPYYNNKTASPVVNVSWDDAVAFCAWATEQDHRNSLLPENARYRLLRDTEWSLVAGLKTETGNDPSERHLKEETMFPWGDAWPPKTGAVNIDAPKVQGYQDNYAYTAPVGSFLPNSLGIHDLGGNVSEWCDDPWPGAADEHVVRGGSWITAEKDKLLTSARQHVQSEKRRPDVGFRCVVDFGP